MGFKFIRLAIFLDLRGIGGGLPMIVSPALRRNVSSFGLWKSQVLNICSSNIALGACWFLGTREPSEIRPYFLSGLLALGFPF